MKVILISKLRRNIQKFMDLANTLVQEWDNIPHAMILRYVRSMRHRLIACIESRGID